MKRTTCIWTLLVIFTHLIHVYVLSKECVTQRSKVLFALDGTTNLNHNQRNLMFQFVQGVVSNLPDGSKCTYVYINEDSKEISRFTVSGSRPNFTEDTELIQWSPAGQSITARALAKEVNVSFPVAFLNRKAEIFYLLVSDTTVIESFPEVLLKKKIFIAVFGLTIPNSLKNLASSTDHIKLIRRLKDLESVVKTVTKLTCKDSRLKCDVDEYMEKWGSTCTSCLSVCSYKTSEQSRACHLHCPYILLPPREYAVMIVKDAMNDDIVTKVVEDYKKVTLGVVLCALSFTILFNVGIGIVCYRKKLLCFHRNALQTDRHGTNFPLPNSKAVPETGGDEDNEPRQTDGVIQPLLDNLPPTRGHVQDHEGRSDPREFLKNENEEEMNHLATGDPQMIDVQTGKHFGTR